MSTGETELAQLEEAPGDPSRASALSAALAARAAVDPDFCAAMEQWQTQAQLACADDAPVHNIISGGVFNGPVLQGRDFSRQSFTTSAATPAGHHRGAPSAAD
ncbi:hypothetical protein [Streptomyces sp. NPDC003487]